MDFTPEQQAAIDAEVEKRVASIQNAQQGQIDIIAQQHVNGMAIQVSSQNAAAALQAAQAQSQAELQAAQATSNLELQAKQSKLAAIQLAQNVLISNRNNKPVSEREISASDITSYAETLVAYVNS
jgi:hypothetical protein